MNTTRIIKGSEKEILELQVNLFDRIMASSSEDGSLAHQAMGSEKDGWCLKVDLGYYSENQLQLIETAMKARIMAGLLSPDTWQVNEDMTRNSFSLTADSPQKLEIIMNDILRGAKVPETNIQIVQQPFAPGMTSTLVTVVLAFGLSEDQMKAVELSAKVAKQGIKVQNFAKKSGMIATTTANVATRVGREVVLAGTEVGATVAVGAVKTGVEMIACAANIGFRDLNPQQIMQGDNVQALAKTLKGLWGNKSGGQITSGFASL